MTSQEKEGSEPLHLNVGVVSLVGPAGPSVIVGASDGGVGSIVNVRADESRKLPARS